MIKQWVAAAVTLAVLTFGAVIALEAVGLLFQPGAPEPKVGSLQPRDVPEAKLQQQHEEGSLAQPPGHAERERQGREAEHLEAAKQALDEERKTADAHRWAERYRREAEQPLAVLGDKVRLAERATETGQVEHTGPPYSIKEAALVGALGEPGSGRLDAGHGDDTKQPAKGCMTPCQVKAPEAKGGVRLVRLPFVRPGQVKRSGAGAADRGSVACPLLGWLQGVMARPAPPVPASARRRAA